jgi:LmbE family N-acetylglucosaminyl deacetylase
MDDCVLACGGTLAKLSDTRRIRLVYATDGTASPVRPSLWRRPMSPELRTIRMNEAREALGLLGIPEKNLQFLDLPERRLARNMDRLIAALCECIAELRPAHVLAPFRYDRHPDHLALNRAVTTAISRVDMDVELFEYFVYYRWRLLPSGDVRSYIRRDMLLEIDIQDVAERKKAALERFTSQTTRFYRWQTRPILTSKLVEEVSRGPECFLRHDPAFQGASVFDRWRLWIPIAHRLEPILKKQKDRVLDVLKRTPADAG